MEKGIVEFCFDKFGLEGTIIVIMSTILVGFLTLFHISTIGTSQLNGKVVVKKVGILNKLTISLTTEGESITTEIVSICKLPNIPLNKLVNIEIKTPIVGCIKLKIKEL